MVTLVKAGLTGAEAREVIKDPNIGTYYVGDFVALLKLGLSPSEIRSDFRHFRTALDKGGYVPNDPVLAREWRKVSTASEARRVVKLLREGKTLEQALSMLRRGGCLVVLAAWIVAWASLGVAGWLVW